MSNVVIPELNDTIDNKQGIWYPMESMKYCAFNTIFYANYGRSISPKNPLYKQLVEVITETFELFQPGLVYSVLPKWCLLFIQLNPYSDYHRIIDVIQRRTAITEKFKQQQLKLKEKEAEQLKDSEHDEENGEAVYYVDYIHKELTDSEVEADMGALFGAGTDTTSTTLNFAIVLSAKYPHLQKKVRDELMEVYKTTKTLNEKDAKDGIKRFNINWIVDHSIVYLRAFIYEVIRVSSVTMVGLPHCTSKDITVQVDKNDDSNEKIEYCIPKDTIIAYVIELVHKQTDTENWVNSSNEMCLENWINKDTKKFEINESFLTFGTGRRDCVGRNLAMKELFVVMAYLFLNYEFSFKNKEDIDKPIKTKWNGVNQIDPPIPVLVTRL